MTAITTCCISISRENNLLSLNTQNTNIKTIHSNISLGLIYVIMLWSCPRVIIFQLADQSTFLHVLQKKEDSSLDNWHCFMLTTLHTKLPLSLLTICIKLTDAFQCSSICFHRDTNWSIHKVSGYILDFVGHCSRKTSFWACLGTAHRVPHTCPFEYM